MTAGWIFLGTMLYLSLAVALAISLIEQETVPEILRHTVRRWAKFLAGLLVVGLLTQVLTWVG